MTFSALSWEPHLISLAQEAIESHVPEERQLESDPVILDQAYRYCEHLTQLNSKTFFMASGLLPGKKRRSIHALYAFCRVCDDIIDRSIDDALLKLEEWREKTIADKPTGDDAVALAWHDTQANFQVPWRYAEQLIYGVAQDIQKTRYQTFDELATYCYGVACTVGLMSMHIIGFSGMEAIPYAIRLGVALQITNILRDVAEDWRIGRVYLPQQELEAFGLNDQDIELGQVTGIWIDYMRFQIERNRQLYREAMPGIPLLDPDGRLAIGAAAEFYQAILSDIEKHNYDVFSRRASISKWGKLRLLPGIWWRVRWNRYR